MECRKINDCLSWDSGNQECRKFFAYRSCRYGSDNRGDNYLAGLEDYGRMRGNDEREPGIIKKMVTAIVEYVGFVNGGIFG